MENSPLNSPNNRAILSITDGTHTQSVSLPAYKLLMRVLSLPEGRHLLALTIDATVTDWTVIGAGKVER